MSICRMFSIIGDQNVRRNMTALNIASRDVMKSAQVIDCVSLSNLDAALNEVKAETEVLIVASITEFLLAGGDCGTIFSSIDPVLGAFTSKMIGFCAYRPALKVTLAHKPFRCNLEAFVSSLVSIFILRPCVAKGLFIGVRFKRSHSH